jgi:hypothetical protein
MGEHDQIISTKKIKEISRFRNISVINLSSTERHKDDAAPPFSDAEINGHQSKF